MRTSRAERVWGARVHTTTAAPPTRVSACFHCSATSPSAGRLVRHGGRVSPPEAASPRPAPEPRAEPPTDLRVVPRSDGFDVSWRAGASTSEYNRDRYEVEMAPTSPRLLELLGDAFGSHVQFYSGPTARARSIGFSRRSPSPSRARCVNRAGASRWVAVDAETCQVPVRWRGGVGPDAAYAWDQTPTHVEVRVPVPPALAPRAVDVRVRPRRLEVRLENREAVAGALRGEVTPARRFRVGTAGGARGRRD